MSQYRNDPIYEPNCVAFALFLIAVLQEIWRISQVLSVAVQDVRHMCIFCDQMLVRGICETVAIRIL
jgi:hypothetical protein